MDYKKIADNTEKGTLSIYATVEEIVAAFREVKKEKAELKGKFRLGRDRVGFYEDGRKQSYARYPLHIVGYGNNINSRGLVMPMRFPSTEAGAVEWVNDIVAVNAA